MGKQIILAAFAAFASLAAAQLANLPTCATNPAIAALSGSKCGLTNFQCICESPEIIAQLQGVVQSACTEEADRSAGLIAAQSLCAPYGGVAAVATPTDVTTGLVTDAAAAAGASTTPTAAGASSTSSWSSATITTVPYHAGNATVAGSSSGTSSNKTATGSPIATGAASKAAAAPAMRDAGFMATFAALIGAAVMM